MGYREERARRTAALSDAICKEINESGCTYGEATSILRTLTHKYIDASHNMVIGKKPAFSTEEV